MGYKCIDFPMLDNIISIWNKDRVGRHENLFILFLNGNKNYRVGTKL